MLSELRTVRQCLRCGAVTGDIRAEHRCVHVESKPVLIYENRMGSDSGYTLGGKLIRGTIVEKPSSCGAYEVFQEHRCGAKGVRP